MDATTENRILEFIQRLARLLHASCEVRVEPRTPAGTMSEGTGATITISSPDCGEVFIGREGEVLGAIEYLARLLMPYGEGGRGQVWVDVNGYRRSRCEGIERVARSTAERVCHTGRPETLQPMSSYERRIVHTALATVSEVVTESIGREPTRRVLVRRRESTE